MEKASLKVFWGLVRRIDETWRRGLNTRLHFGQVAAPLLKTRWRSSFRSGSWIQQGLCAKLIRGWWGGGVRGERTWGGFSGSNTDCIHSQCGAASRGYQYLHDFVFFFFLWHTKTPPQVENVFHVNQRTGSSHMESFLCVNSGRLIIEFI